MSASDNRQLRLEIEREKEKYLKRMMEVGNQCESYSVFIPEDIKGYPQMNPGVRFPDPLSATCTMDNFDQKLNDMKRSMELQLNEFKMSMQQHLNVIQGQLKMTIELLAEQNVLIKHSKKNSSPDQPGMSIQLDFPINTDEELIDLNNNINAENKNLYIEAVRNVIQSEGIYKTLRYVLGDDITNNYNIDGTQGKKGFKEYKKVHNVILDAIKLTKDGQHSPADTLLRKAMNAQKKRYHRQISRKRKAANESDNDLSYT